jgi:hypothetical protein
MKEFKTAKNNLIKGKALDDSNPNPTSKTASPDGTRPKPKARRYAVIGIVLVIIIIVLAVVATSINSPEPTHNFLIVSSDAYAVSNTTGGFNARISFTIKNNGSEAGNVMVIYKVFTPSDYWGGARLFTLLPGHSQNYTTQLIPVKGDPNGEWHYQCYIEGEKAVNYPHS